MRVDRKQMYGYSRPAAYGGELSRVGPVRRRFAAIAITVAILLTGIILLVGRAVAGGL